MAQELPYVGLIWGQFAAYHIDRCEAVARQLAGRFRIRAVEVATSSRDYAWEVSGKIAGVEKKTLFPGAAFEAITLPRRLIACWNALRNCDFVFMGLPYSLPEAIILSWTLRFAGVRVIMMTESKVDDRPRSAWKERIKALLLRAYHGALVGARRQAEYCALLGFSNRPVEPGYDTLSIARVRLLSSQPEQPEALFEGRPLLFVGRFVDKKDPLSVLHAYAHYRGLAGSQPRRLIMAGAGPLSDKLKQEALELGISAYVDFPGFLDTREVSVLMASALMLLLPSREEQWGLVVNEALAVGLPVMVSNVVGACDALVRHGENGYVVAPGAVEEMGRAMALLSADRACWQAMSKTALAMAPNGDVGHFADGVEFLIDPGDQALAQRVSAFRLAVGMDRK